MRSSFYIFTLIGKKFLTLKFLGQNQTEKNCCKAITVKKEKEKSANSQVEELRKIVQQNVRVVCTCVSILTFSPLKFSAVVSVVNMMEQQHLGFEAC